MSFGRRTVVRSPERENWFLNLADAGQAVEAPHSTATRVGEPLVRQMELANSLQFPETRIFTKTNVLTIAFRPRDGRFEVADAAIRNDPEFLPNVTELWSGGRPKSQIRRELLNALDDKGRAVDGGYEDAVERNLEVAHAISDYRFPTVDIRKTTAGPAEEASEEDVSEIFVRINNQGKRLGQADFVLTLLSVFHGPLRDRIEVRAREMSEGAVIGIDTQQLLRAACGVAFGRARMSAVYRYLRGVDDGGSREPLLIAERTNPVIDEAGAEIATAGWLPGHHWSKTVFSPIYWKAARENDNAAARFFGQLVWYTVMNRPERWASGRYEKDGQDIGSRTYFRVR